MLTTAFVSNPFRRMALAALLLAAAFATLAFSPNRAEARSVWCAGDPVVVVNGSAVSITAHIPADRVRDVKYVDFVFHVPSNAHVDAIIDDGLVFNARIRVVKDLPAAYGLVNTPINVDMTVVHRGSVFPVAASTVAVGQGTNLWVDGTSARTLTIQTTGLLNLPTASLGLPTIELALPKLFGLRLF